MFSRRVFGGTPDSFKLVLEYGRENTKAPMLGQVRLPMALATSEVTWNSEETVESVLERFTQAKSRVQLDRAEERLLVKLTPSPHGGDRVSLKLSVACLAPALRCVQVVRVTNSGNVSEPLLAALFKHCDLSGVWKLRGAEGFGNFWCSCCEVGSWAALANMNLSSCGLTALPAAVGALGSLRILRLSHNRLASLPPELSGLSSLEVLAADHNLLTALPAELRRCSALRHLELEGNRLATPVLDLRALSGLVSLQLYGNPLEYLPELSPASALRSLSLANVRIMADAAYTRWEVEVAALPYMSRVSHKLAPLFKLTFRRSSCQHPLLAGALGRISEDRAQCELMAREETAIQQLVLMALSEAPVVAEQACRTLGALAALGLGTARRLLAHDVLSTILTLLRSPRRASKLCGLGLLSSLAAASEAVAAELLSRELLALLADCGGAGRISDTGAAAFSALLGSPPTASTSSGGGFLARHSAALMSTSPNSASAGGAGENEVVARAVGTPPIRGRGLRVLALDGGGMRGLALVQILRHIEKRTGRPLHGLFDLVVGTSTGAIVAVGLGVFHFSLDQCEAIYTGLGHKVFNQGGWRDSLFRVVRGTSTSLRVAVYGFKHDASTFEELLRQMCEVKKLGCVGNQMIDAAALGGPKVAAVATLVSVCPVTPFLFTTYELPPEAVRASSAAPYYLDDFLCGEDRFQDGAATANNPGILALQQARLLWPNTPVEALVSVGCGAAPSVRREKGAHAMLDTGAVLVDAATSPDRADEALSTLLPLVPGCRYFRFQPVHERCAMELDDVDPAHWAALQPSSLFEYFFGNTGSGASTSSGGASAAKKPAAMPAAGAAGWRQDVVAVVEPGRRCDWGLVGAFGELVAARESISFGGATPGVQELLARQGKHERTGGVGHTRDEGGEDSGVQSGVVSLNAALEHCGCHVPLAALPSAAAAGHVEACGRLRERLAAEEHQGWGLSAAVHAAAKAGHSAVLALLLGPTEMYCSDAALGACAGGHLNLLSQLQERYRCFRTDKCEFAMSAASAGQTQVLEALLPLQQARWEAAAAATIRHFDGLWPWGLVPGAAAAAGAAQHQAGEPGPFGIPLTERLVRLLAAVIHSPTSCWAAKLDFLICRWGAELTGKVLRGELDGAYSYVETGPHTPDFTARVRRLYAAGMRPAAAGTPAGVSRLRLPEMLAATAVHWGDADALAFLWDECGLAMPARIWTRLLMCADGDTQGLLAVLRLLQRRGQAFTLKDLVVGPDALGGCAGDCRRQLRHPPVAGGTWAARRRWFEAEAVEGGRVQEFAYKGEALELGASMFWQHNRYSGSWWEVARAAVRYGSAALSYRWRVAAAFRRFQRAHLLRPAAWWLWGGRAFIEEAAAAVGRCNYNQRTDQLNALAAAYGSVWAIQGGNRQLVSGLLAASGARVLRRGRVRVARRHAGTGLWWLEVESEGEGQTAVYGPYQAVVLAAPLVGSGLAIEDHDAAAEQSADSSTGSGTGSSTSTSRAPSGDGVDGTAAALQRPYQVTITTFVAAGRLRAAFFNASALPPGLSAVLVTDSAQPHSTTGRQAPVLGAVRSTWPSKPMRRFAPPERFPPFLLAPGLVYGNALEGAASAMEMAAVAAANSALLGHR
eukprot:XP_001702734.1 predicted protein [Chlamydomonas reinhardtii]